MLSPKDIGSKANGSSIWSIDSGYETNNVSEDHQAVLPTIRARAARDAREYQRNDHAPVVFNRGDFWNAPASACLREDSLVDPITTQLNVFTTRDASENNVVLPEIPTSDQTCLQCKVSQPTNSELNIKCKKCRAPSMRESIPATMGFPTVNRDVLPRLDIPEAHSRPLKRIRSPSQCSDCEVTGMGDAKCCSSCFSGSSRLSPMSSSPSEHRVKRSRAGRNSKLPINALSRLQSWLDANKHNPYPTAETKRSLAQECGITEKQVNTWFTNARARQMSVAECGSEDDGTGYEYTEIPPANLGISAYRQDTMQSDPSHRRVSVASQSRARTSRRGKKKDYRRNQNVDAPQTPQLLSPASITSPADQSAGTDQEMWQCTFCLKALVPKSWRRHEDTQHRPKTQAARWTCMHDGPRLRFPNRTNSGSVCAFCMVKNPSDEHFMQHHRIEECSKRDVADRTFYRPDHLRQHIKNFHNATLFDIVQARWKKSAETVAEGWTCGFCGDQLETWEKRESHIANHFKEGMTMAAWRDYSDMEKAAEKKKGKGKAKSKEKDHGTVLDHIRNPFRRHDPSHHDQPHPQNTAFANPFIPLPVSPQTQTLRHTFQPPVPAPALVPVPHCSPPLYQPPYTSPAPIPAPAPIGLGISQPPVLPEIPIMSPFMGGAGFANYIDWSAAAVPTQQLQFPLPHTVGNAYQGDMAGVGVGYGGALGLDGYGGAVGYEGSGEWGEECDSRGYGRR